MKTKYINIDLLLHQYIVGVVFGLCVFLLLFSSSTISYSNIQAPVGKYAHNIWSNGFDFYDYYKPAVNFLNYGVFGSGTLPDNCRTIGYPVFLALTMFLFGKKWLYATYFINCILLPLILPALSYISNSLYGNRRVTRFLFWFALIAYIPNVTYVATDYMFFMLFVCSLAVCVKFFQSKQPKYLLLYIVFISIAAEVRPTLLFYPIINIFWFIFLQKKFELDITMFKRTIVASTVCLLLLCNIPSIRNYINYNFFAPSTDMTKDCFQYLAKKVYMKENKINTFDSLNSIISVSHTITEKMSLEKKYSFQTVKDYPITTIKVIFDNVVCVMLDINIKLLPCYYGYQWKKLSTNAINYEKYNYPYKSSSVLTFVYYLFMLPSVLVYLLFVLSIRHLIFNKDYSALFFISSLFIFMLAPNLIFGSGGVRYRVCVEWLIILSSLNYWEMVKLNLFKRRGFFAYKNRLR